MKHVSGAREQPASTHSKRPARFSVVSLALPIVGALICAVSVPGSQPRSGEMFSSGLLLCLFCLVGGAIVGLILAVVAIIRGESPAVLWVAALIINAAIIIYAYS
jgi:hypothetical protein